MKKFIFALTMCAMCVTSMMAQSTKEERAQFIKARKDYVKMTAKAAENKLLKDAKKEAKRLTKEGWKPAPGGLPLERQLDGQYRKRYEASESNAPKYIMGQATNTGGNYTAAKKAALEFARQEVANQIESEVRELIEASVINQETSSDEAESLTKVLSSAITKVHQTIGSLPIVTEAYRDVDGGKKEVLLVVAYESRLAKNSLLKAMMEESEEMRKKVELIIKEWE